MEALRRDLLTQKSEMEAMRVVCEKLQQKSQDDRRDYLRHKSYLRKVNRMQATQARLIEEADTKTIADLQLRVVELKSNVSSSCVGKNLQASDEELVQDTVILYKDMQDFGISVCRHTEYSKFSSWANPSLY